VTSSSTGAPPGAGERGPWFCVVGRGVWGGGSGGREPPPQQKKGHRLIRSLTTLPPAHASTGRRATRARPRATCPRTNSSSSRATVRLREGRAEVRGRVPPRGVGWYIHAKSIQSQAIRTTHFLDQYMQYIPCSAVPPAGNGFCQGIHGRDGGGGNGRRRWCVDMCGWKWRM
jgi:hypothetical protein